MIYKQYSRCPTWFKNNVSRVLQYTAILLFSSIIKHTSNHVKSYLKYIYLLIALVAAMQQFLYVQMIKWSHCLQFGQNVCSVIPHNTAVWHIQPAEIVRRGIHQAEQAQTTFETSIDSLVCLRDSSSRPSPSLLFCLESNIGAGTQYVMHLLGMLRE